MKYLLFLIILQFTCLSSVYTQVPTKTIRESKICTLSILNASDNCGESVLTFTTGSCVLNSLTLKKTEDTSFSKDVWIEPGELGVVTVTSSGTYYLKGVGLSTYYSNEYEVAISEVTILAGGISDGQKICGASGVISFSEVTAASGGNGTFTYGWQKSTNNGNSWNTIPTCS